MLELGKGMVDDDEPLSISIGMALSTTLHVFACGVPDENADDWRRVITHASNLPSFRAGLNGAGDAAIQLVLDRLDEGDEGPGFRLMCDWIDLVFPTEDGPLDDAAMDAVVSAFATVFGLVVCTLTPAMRERYQEEIRHTCSNLRSAAADGFPEAA